MVNFFSESVFFNSALIHPLPGRPVYDLPVDRYKFVFPNCAYSSLVIESVTLRLRPNVELFLGRTKLLFGSTLIESRSSVGSDVKLRTRRTNQLNETKKQF